MRWTDSSGNFWLFGGWGLDSTGTVGELNDLWEYSNGEWTWMGGSDLVNQPASYGFEGVPSATNIPGGRDGGAVWTDTSGNVWLFGGETGAQTLALNDFWKYSNGLWTWMGGTQLFDNLGSYGTLGTPDPSNFPGARINSVHWVDAQGNLWLFAGGDQGPSAAALGNDLWMYKP
jgi:N-acetylneuraminic acid mutarotase